MSNPPLPSLAALVAATKQVGSFPAIIHRLERAMEDPHHSLPKIGSIVAEDPGLAARVLKLANSALFSFPHPVSTITQALTLIGSQQFHDLIFSSMVTHIFQGISSPRVNMHAFWCHSIACGTAARVIATARREPNVEHYYLTGLLHDIGRLVIFSQLPQEADLLLAQHQQQGCCLYELEEEILGFDHGTLGSELLHSWNLPPDIYQPIRWHHHAGDATDYQLETAILHVADFLANTFAQGSSGEGLTPPLQPLAWEQIDLPVSTAGGIVRQFAQQLLEAQDIFLE